ncbi:MAG: plasmid pRiA4b ORF-3 family protein [Chloroflexi bacterium]|nr:plasmid pRiA4b ORF-3 family protein [Chloroflexota bacterium]
MDSPGSILRDFGTLIDFARNNKLLLTAKHQLPLSALADINARLAHPIQLGLKRPQQKSYPHIHGLFLVARASGLTTVDGTGKQPVLVIDDDMVQQWENLNPTECYGTLLEAWLLRGKPEIVGERGRPFGMLPDNFERSASFYVRLPGDGLPVAGNRDAEEGLRYYPEWYNLGLLDLFGLIRIEHGSLEPGKGWQIEWIHRTPLGDALLALLYTEFFSDFDNLFRLEDEGKMPFGVLQPVLQPYFPAWQNNLSVPELEFRKGTFIFKVALGRIWRRIAIDAGQTLDALAWAILGSVKFDSDHLYQFSYQTRYGSLQEVNHPYMDAPPFTSEMRIGELPLRVGQTMTFLFDFGDNWEFDVLLEQVDPDRVTKKSAILESHGKAPEQYPGWGDWE